MSWPWGTYLGEEALRIGIRTKISTWQRIPPNVVPHASKATGVYLNSMLAVTEAHNAGYDEAIMLTPEGTVADGPGETIFVVRDGVIYTPDLSTGILHGITRDSIIQIAHDLGYTVLEKTLIRSDLYLADEVFMCGTAAEVTPVRSVDDHEIGVGEVTLRDPEGVSRHGARRERPLVAVARARAAARARSRVTTATRRIDLSAPWIDERDEELVLEVLRSGRLSLGPTGPRFEALLADAVGAPYCAAVSSGTAGLHLCMRLAGVGPGDEVITSPYSFVASANCAIYEGATPVFADIDPQHAQPRPGRGRGGDHAAHAGDRRRRHLRLSVRARRAAARSASGTGSRSSRTRARRSARATRAGRSARTATPRRWRSIRTSR